MANTYIALAKSVLTSSASFVDFDSIPQTYTDLIIVASTRDDGGAGEQNIVVRNNKAAFTSARGIEGNGSAASSNTFANQGSVPNTTFTATTFNNSEFYILNYTRAGNHQTSSTVVNENNAATITNGIRATAAVDSETTAVTSIRIACSGASFVSGSSFYLYGIKST
jgi:hypothetical protein